MRAQVLTGLGCCLGLFVGCGNAAPAPSKSGAAGSDAAASAGSGGSQSPGAGNSAGGDAGIGAGGALSSGGSTTTGGASSAGSSAGGGTSTGGTSTGGTSTGGTSTGGTSTVLIDPPPELVWTSENNNGPFAGIWGTGPDNIYAGGINGVMTHWDGTKWTRQDAKPLAGEHITGMWGSSAEDIYASVNANVLFHSTGDGTWTHIDFTGPYGFSDIWGTSATNVYGVYGGWLTHKAATGGWSARESVGDDYGVDKIWGVGDSDIWAVSVYGQVTHYTGPGKQTGQLVGGDSGQFTTAELSDIWASGPNDIYVVGSNCILHSTGNKVWVNQFPADAPRDLIASIWGFDAHTIYAVAGSGRVYRSGGDGRWVSQMVDPQGVVSTFCGLWGTSPQNMYVSGDSGLYHGVLP